LCLFTATWWMALAWVSWQPFRVGDPVPFDWVPGMPLESGNPLWALEEMLTKLVLFGLGGVLLASSMFGTSRRLAFIAAGFGFLASAFFEIGQTRFTGHTPCITDALLGGIGAFCGAWVTGRVRMSTG
jgi:VanZ family protein